MPSLATPYEQFLQELDNHKDIWWGLAARAGRTFNNPYIQCHCTEAQEIPTIPTRTTATEVSHVSVATQCLRQNKTTVANPSREAAVINSCEMKLILNSVAPSRSKAQKLN